MTWFNVEQLYVVIVTLTLGATAASLLTACEEFYQFVLAAILYGGTSRKCISMSNDIAGNQCQLVINDSFSYYKHIRDEHAREVYWD